MVPQAHRGKGRKGMSYGHERKNRRCSMGMSRGEKAQMSSNAQRLWEWGSAMVAGDGGMGTSWGVEGLMEKFNIV